MIGLNVTLYSKPDDAGNQATVAGIIVAVCPSVPGKVDVRAFGASGSALPGKIVPAILYGYPEQEGHWQAGQPVPVFPGEWGPPTEGVGNGSLKITDLDGDETTNPEAASAAARVLNDPDASADAKTAAASALTQAPNKDQDKAPKDFEPTIASGHPDNPEG